MASPTKISVGLPSDNGQDSTPVAVTKGEDRAVAADALVSSVSNTGACVDDVIDDRGGNSVTCVMTAPVTTVTSSNHVTCVMTAPVTTVTSSNHVTCVMTAPVTTVISSNQVRCVMTAPVTTVTMSNHVTCDPPTTTPNQASLSPSPAESALHGMPHPTTGATDVAAEGPTSVPPPSSSPTSATAAIPKQPADDVDTEAGPASQDSMVACSQNSDDGFLSPVFPMFNSRQAADNKKADGFLLSCTFDDDEDDEFSAPNLDFSLLGTPSERESESSVMSVKGSELADHSSPITRAVDAEMAVDSECGSGERYENLADSGGEEEAEDAGDEEAEMMDRRADVRGAGTGERASVDHNVDNSEGNREDNNEDNNEDQVVLEDVGAEDSELEAGHCSDDDLDDGHCSDDDLDAGHCSDDDLDDGHCSDDDLDDGHCSDDDLDDGHYSDDDLDAGHCSDDDLDDGHCSDDYLDAGHMSDDEDGDRLDHHSEHDSSSAADKLASGSQNPDPDAGHHSDHDDDLDTVEPPLVNTGSSTGGDIAPGSSSSAPDDTPLLVAVEDNSSDIFLSTPEMNDMMDTSIFRTASQLPCPDVSLTGLQEILPDSPAPALSQESNAGQHSLQPGPSCRTDVSIGGSPGKIPASQISLFSQDCSPREAVVEGRQCGAVIAQ